MSLCTIPLAFNARIAAAVMKKKQENIEMGNEQGKLREKK